MDTFFAANFYPGRMFNGIVVLVLALTALLLGYTILKTVSKKSKTRNFGYFWFFTGIAWGTSTVRQFFSAFDMLEIDKQFFTLTETMIMVSGIFLAPYLFDRVFNKPLTTRLVGYLYISGAFASAVGLYVYGSELTEPTMYATDYEPNKYTLILIIILIGILFITSFYESVKQLWNLIKKRVLWHRFLAPFSIMTYLLFGIIDISGLIGGWPLIVFRLVFLTAFIMAYIAFVEEISIGKASEGGKNKVIEI